MAKNSFFQFKKFLINQDQCGMKVCTDACIFGAYIDLKGAEAVLDIGSGTGLLTLMLAQRYNQTLITGVEIDEGAFQQSVQNINESSFSDNINLVNCKIQEFKASNQFDVIISNPPFYQQYLQSGKIKKNQAHHAVSLNFEDLLSSITRLLKLEGIFYVLLPEQESTVFKSLCENKGWFLSQELCINNDANKKPFRRIMAFSRIINDNKMLNYKVLNIYNTDSRSYTESFKTLLNPYYLQF